jgi:hypothetical protein
MSASTVRLNLAIKVGPEDPDDIETILSGPWPILIDYWCKDDYPTDSSLKRMYSALEHHDRVRGIRLHGEACWFDNSTSSRRPVAPFPHWRSFTFTKETSSWRSQIRFLGDQIYRICVYGVFHCATSPSHRYPDFYHPRRLSRTSFWNSILLSAHQQECPLSPVCKACIACANSI